MQEFTRSEKRQLRAQRFEREAERSVAEKAAVIAAIQRDTALAWLDRYYAEAIAAVIAQQAAEAKLEIVAAEAAYRAGRGSQADVFAAHGAVVGFEDMASEFGRRIRTARTALARWIGDAAEAPLAATRHRVPFISIPQRWTPISLITPKSPCSPGRRRSPSTEARLAAGEQQAGLERGGHLPQRGSAFSNMVSIGVSIPLQWDQKNRQDRELASKLALADQAQGPA